MISETLKFEIQKKTALCRVLRGVNPLCTTSCEWWAPWRDTRVWKLAQHLCKVFLP